MMLTVAACGKEQETAQAPQSPTAAQQTTPQAAPPPVSTAPAQTAPQASTSEPATPTTGQAPQASTSSDSAAPTTGQSPQASGSEPATPTTGQTTEQSSGSSGSSGEYTVSKGDTLASIAQENNLNYQDIVNWNNIKDPNRIYEGQTLRLTAP